MHPHDTVVDPSPTTAADDTAPVTLPDAPESLRAQLADGGAVAWAEPLTIPTYDAGEPSAYPMYFDHRVYQGSSGRIYPIPFVESVANEARDHAWQAIHLENEFVRLVVLPQLGGRIHIGYDKTTDYDFFYRNNVIKPALVGLGGPWISGGVEFNWPQHHRPATYLPVEAKIENGADGSVTVWCSDHDPFARMQAQHGIRLRPGSSVVEVAVRLHNRTSERQTFLWWANVAARVNDDYQSFFPDDVRYVADHARRAITSFPRADRPYYGVDYAALAAQEPGADRIDFYRNIKVPTSYMIVDSQQDFFGGYDHGVGAGFVHWAERRVSPGKKLWTWGNAPFGHAWDDQLTDADGPYVELMAGVYTDNQPDFTWLLPGETKVFTQHWYPIGAIGPAAQATPDAAVGVNGETARFATTSVRPGVRMVLRRAGETVAAGAADLRPGEVASLTAHGGFDEAELRDADGALLVRWQPSDVSDEEPWVAEEPPSAEELTAVDELYLTGMHLSQYRHPTRWPLPYWEAALRIDPGDVRTHFAVADHQYRQGRYAVALASAEAGLARLTRRNENPTSTEGYYLAGLALARLGRVVEAERRFGKAGWDGAWAAAAGLELARSLASRREDRAALRVLDTLDGVVGHDTRRVALRAVLLRRSGAAEAADALVRDALVADPLDATLRVLAGESPEDAGVRFDVAVDLWRAGDASGALALLETVAGAAATPSGNWGPIAHYLAAQISDAEGLAADAVAHRERARRADLQWAFPCGLDQLDALVAAVAADESDAVARYLLGTQLYAVGRREEASQEWERAIDLGLEHPVLFRNAGLCAYNVADDEELAWRRYEQAVALRPDDARLRFEQDQLAARLGHSPADRLHRLDSARERALERDDLTIAYVELLASQGRAAEGLEILTTRQFHPWEGGEGKTIAAWDAVHEALGLPLADPPANLGETRPAYTAPAPVRDDGVTDYFATSLPDLLLFHRESRADDVA